MNQKASEIMESFGIHYTAKGHKTMAEMVELKLREIFKDKAAKESS